IAEQLAFEPSLPPRQRALGNIGVLHGQLPAALGRHQGRLDCFQEGRAAPFPLSCLTARHVQEQDPFLRQGGPSSFLSSGKPLRSPPPVPHARRARLAAHPGPRPRPPPRPPPAPPCPGRAVRPPRRRRPLARLLPPGGSSAAHTARPPGRPARDSPG